MTDQVANAGIIEPSNYPGRTYAVGGSGIELAKQTYTHPQVVREHLKPGAGTPDRTVITLIDTAQNEHGAVTDVASDIRDVRDEQRAKLESEYDQPLGTIEVDHEIITDSILLQAGQDLTGPEVVQAITENHSMDPDDWFVSEAALDENLDFSRGVYKRRALALAVFLKAMVADRQVRDIVDMPANGKAAILASTGGGTGAGLAPKIARLISETAPATDVTLFSVLPTHREETRAQANAFAALSELENAQLGGDDSLFRDIVLSPIDATGYEGKRGTDLAKKKLREFDIAFPFLFTAYYNTDHENVFENTASFAPFTIAIPQVLRYTVGESEQVRDDLETAVAKLDEMLVDAIEMHRTIRTVVHEHYHAAEPNLTDDQQKDLQRWLSDIESLASRQLFGEFDYTATAQFREKVTESAGEGTTIEGQIDRLETLTRDLSHERLTFVDNFDKTVATTLRRAAQFLQLRAETLQELSAVHDDSARMALSEALDVGHGSIEDAFLKHRRLEKQLADLTDDRDELRSRRSNRVAELEDAQSTRAEAIDRKLETWRSDTSDGRDCLQAAAEGSIRDPFKELRSALVAYKKSVVSATTPGDLEALSDEEIQQALGRIETLCDQVGFDQPDSDPVRRAEIERAVETLRKARRESLKTEPDVGLLDRIRPWESEAEQRARDAQNRLDNFRGTLEMDDVFTIYGNTSTAFSCEVTYDPGRGIESIRAHLQSERRGCIEALEDVIDGSLAADQRTELAKRLDDGQSVTDLARTVIEDQIAPPTELRDDIAELDEQLATLESQIERLEAIETNIDAFLGKDGLRETIEAAYQIVEPELTDPDESRSVRSDENFTYVRSVKPNGLHETVGKANIAEAGLLEARSQQQGLSDQLGSFVANVQANEYNGLQKREIKDGARRYDGAMLHVCFQSQAIGQLPAEQMQVVSRLTDAFGLENRGSDLSYRKFRFGSTWDLGFCVFIDGVPLDNIRNIHDYYQAYQQRIESGDSIHLHHSYRLSEGRFVRRETLLNLADPEQARLFTSFDEEAVIDVLVDDFETWVATPENAVADQIGGASSRPTKLPIDTDEGAADDGAVESDDRTDRDEPADDDDAEAGIDSVDTEQTAEELVNGSPSDEQPATEDVGSDD